MEGYNVTTMLKRLEAATSRLEDLVTVCSGDVARQDSQVSPKGSRSPAAASGPAAATTSAVAPTAQSAFAELSGPLDEFIKLSNDIDPALGQQAIAIKAATDAMDDIVGKASASKQPQLGSQEFIDLLRPLSEKLGIVGDLREQNRKSKAANHLATVAEGSPALGWVSATSPAGAYVQDFKDSAQFYSNRVLKENKEHAAWAKSFLAYLDALKTAVKPFTKGLTWSANGKPLTDVLGSSEPAAAPASKPAGGAVPPPPPPPSVEQLTQKAAPAAAAPAGGMSAVLSEISQGSSVTSGLKPVKRAPQAPPKPASLKKGPEAATPKLTTTKPPSTQLENNRWVVENYVDAHDLEVVTELNQSVLVSNCRDCTIQVKGKSTSVTMTKCEKTGVVVETLISGVEIIKSSRFGLQVTGTMPSLTIDQSHDGSIYLSKEALDVDIYTSQIAAVNVNVPKEEEGDYVECPLAEQVLHKVDGYRIKSTAVGAADK